MRRETWPRPGIGGRRGTSRQRRESCWSCNGLEDRIEIPILKLVHKRALKLETSLIDCLLNSIVLAIDKLVQDGFQMSGFVLLHKLYAESITNGQDILHLGVVHEALGPRFV